MAHTFLVESYPWTEDRLKAVLANLLKSAIYNDRERVFELANRVITGQASRFSDGTGRSLLLTWFEDPNLEYFKRLIRPLLGPLSKKSGANGAALLAYDLKEALASNNVATIKSLCKLGAKVNPHQFMELVERYNGNSQDTLHALLEAQKFTAEELGRILKGCIRRHGDFVDYLLDPARSVKPHIDYNVVRECMISKSMKLHVVYTKILKAAAEQPAIIDKANQARRMALNRGGVWETAWMEYEAVYDESDGEDDDDEDEDDE